MRMRRKRRMDLRLEDCMDFVLDTPITINMKDALNYKNYFDFDKVFGNSNPLELEVGTGKGGFILKKAELNPNTNYIGVEKFSNVLLDGLEHLKGKVLSNVRFMGIRAECLECYIPNNSISKIYLNFPTPLPKRGYEKQRLTYPKFLQIYKNILKPNGIIELKTDQKDFFEYSIIQLEKEGFDIIKKIYDLHSNEEEMVENVITEHEAFYSQKGCPIFKLISTFH